MLIFIKILIYTVNINPYFLSLLINMVKYSDIFYYFFKISSFFTNFNLI